LRRRAGLIASLILAGLLTLAVLPLQQNVTAQSALQQAGPSAATRIYLPLVRAPQSAQPPPPPSEGRFFLQRDSWTSRARVAVDAAGGIHLAYKSAEPGPTTPAYYAYCPPGGGCTSAAAFRTVALSDNISDVQLALTPDGKPRLLLERAAPPVIGAFGVVYDYAACDTDCTSAAQWGFVRVARSSHIDTNRSDRPWRVFAVDGSGRPHFAYYNGITSFYVTCEADCLASQPGEPHWTETALTLPSGGGGDIPQMSLALTSAGQPRLLGEVYTDQQPGAGLYHLSCDADCTSSESWARTRLVPITNVVVAQHDLEVTTEGGLRAVVMLYHPVPDGPYPKELFYVVCETDCLQAESWLANSVGLAQDDGEHAELELDAQGRPRIAYRRDDGGGLGYRWCDSQCETDQAQWRTLGADESSRLEQELESYDLDSCQKGLWSAGWMPALALDAQGNPRIAAEALQLVRCFAKPNPTSPIEQGVNTLRYTRLIVLPRP
jgi:hypothetical protein